MDVIGAALLDYHQGNYSEDIITETNISEEDILPLPYLFRGYKEMPKIERKALDLCKGKVLDVGCGSGCHSLYLQKKGFVVTAIDTSEGAAKVTEARGVKDVRNLSLLTLTDEKYDTIIMLMNGTGIFGKMDRVAEYLNHLKNLMSDGGQILIDSSDLQYMYDRDEYGAIYVPADHYYGELEFTISYKEKTTEKYPWLYLDEARFSQACTLGGLHFEVVQRGENFDYLARITF